MAYDKFNTLKSSAVPLPIENVDTDQIIPATFFESDRTCWFWRQSYLEIGVTTQDNSPKN